MKNTAGTVLGTSNSECNLNDSGSFNIETPAVQAQQLWLSKICAEFQSAFSLNLPIKNSIQQSCQQWGTTMVSSMSPCLIVLDIFQVAMKTPDSFSSKDGRGNFIHPFLSRFVFLALPKTMSSWCISFLLAPCCFL
jgi:hypothetical protein